MPNAQPLPSHVQTMYTKCDTKNVTASSFTLHYEMKATFDYKLFEKTVKDFSAAYTTGRGAHVTATFGGSAAGAGGTSFDVTFETAPIAGAMGAIMRPFVPSEIKMFGFALEKAGMLPRATRMKLDQEADRAPTLGRRP